MSDASPGHDDFPGRSLGLPQHGPGSLARVGRRAAALAVDWAACSLLSFAFFDYSSLATLLLFGAEQLLFTALLGAGFGHVLLGMRVHRHPADLVGPASGGRPATTPPPPVAALVRTVLLLLVLPAIIPDAHGRGLHDRLAGTVLLRK